MIFPGRNNLPERPYFPDILRPFFDYSSGVLRKNPLFSEADPKKTRSGPEEMQVSTGHRLPKPAKTGHKLPKHAQAMANSKTGDTFVPLNPKKATPWHQSQKRSRQITAKAGTAAGTKRPGQDLIRSRARRRRAVGKPLLRQVKSRRTTGFSRQVKNITVAPQTRIHHQSGVAGTGLTADRTLPDEDAGRKIRGWPRCTSAVSYRHRLPTARTSVP
ncbi:hypothetical protein [Chryseobacterium gregarium]|uniref:hypothetical protein n=1 Tax=Chryseobacterium gregarium TaxID=456299 RepID=UPI000486C91A|nr:hypothetical protein [Chryseobacterium gregarium]